jgi:hypothetical protein
MGVPGRYLSAVWPPGLVSLRKDGGKNARPNHRGLALSAGILGLCPVAALSHLEASNGGSVGYPALHGFVFFGSPKSKVATIIP